jgi:hypothetical protein
MTGYPGFNYPAFDDARDALLAEGWEVISPADLDRVNLGIDFSTMTGTEDLSEFRTEFARQDVDALLKVHAVFLLDGWEASTGARNEATIASMLGVPLFSFSTREPVDFEAHFSHAPKPIIEDDGEVRMIDPDTGGEKGTKLARFELLPAAALWAVAEHFGKGAEKYAARNWERGYAWSLSYGALMRHAFAYWGGEDVDPETGSPHMAAVVFHALALLTFADTHPEKDDRP